MKPSKPPSPPSSSDMDAEIAALESSSPRPADQARHDAGTAHREDSTWYEAEHQHVEWKESWRDECLKWISGFANAEGGVLVIGR